MSERGKGFLATASEVLDLARGYGRRRLLGAFAMIALQGVFQVIGVTSIFPFLAIASDPNAFRASTLGKILLQWVPQNTDQQLLMAAGVVSICMLVISNAISLSGDYYRACFSNGVGYYLRREILWRVSRRPYAQFIEQNTSSTMQKLQADVVAYVNSVLGPLLEFGAAIITVALLLGTIMIVNPWIPLCAAVVIGAFYWIVDKALRPKVRLLGDRLMETNRGSYKALSELLQGIKTVLVYDKSGYFIKAYDRFVCEQRDILPRIPLYANSPRYMIEPLAFGGLVVVVLVFAARGEKLAEMLPSLGVVTLAAYRLIPEAQKAYSKVNGMMTYAYVVGELRSEIDQPIIAGTNEAQHGAPISFCESIHLKDVTFKYSRAKAPTLNHLSLTIPKNSSVGIAGPTGSGKTTLADILLGLHWPSSGKILVDGIELAPTDMHVWRRMIGYVPQEVYLLDESVEANIAFGVPPQEIDRSALMKAAAAAHILNFIESELPDGWRTKVGERGVRLSGGQRQRIGLARALYRQPSILILDEATSALDNETENSVLEAIESLRGEVTMIVVAHRLNTLEKCDSVYRLSGPKVADADFGTQERMSN